jgi:hypothetical protein
MHANHVFLTDNRLFTPFEKTGCLLNNASKKA